MPKRLDEARVLAAVAADDPPASADHRDDDEWHAAQDMWLVKWSGSVLPDGPQRRLKWNDRVKEHARLVAAAARAVALPASMPRRKGARKAPVPTPHEPMQPANMPERASPARPPEDREDLGLPPLAAVSIEPQQHASAPAAASMFSLLSPPPQPPAQRTATERAAKRVRHAERERQMCEEGERALWHDAVRASPTWWRIHDPSDDEGGPPCPEACEPLFEAQDKVGDEAGDEVGEEAEDHDEDHDETNRSLNRFGASRSANSSAAHSIAASPFHAIPSRSPFHAIPSRSIRSIWDGRMWHERTAHEIWDGRMSGGRRMRWAHDPNKGLFLLEVSPTDASIWDGRNGWDGRARY